MLLISPEGDTLGELEITQARYLADELGLDLVEMSRDADPVVVKLADYGKMKYEKSLREREARKNRPKPQKTLQLRPVIADGDYETKLRHLREFLDDGHPVQVVVKLQGRENQTPEVGFELLDRILGDVGDRGQVDQKPNREGRQISMRLSAAA